MIENNIENIPVEELIQSAIQARKKAYAPYSGYYVGAAVLTMDNRIYTGCNIENASYGATICAERTAVFKAVSEGRGKCRALAVVGSPQGDKITRYTFPCGVCRQVISEFTPEPKEFMVIVAQSKEDYKLFSLEELLPVSFSADKLLNNK